MNMLTVSVLVHDMFSMLQPVRLCTVLIEQPILSSYPHAMHNMVGGGHLGATWWEVVILGQHGGRWST